MPFLACTHCGQRITALITEQDAPPADRDAPGQAFMTKGTYVPSWNHGFVLHRDDVTGTDRHPDPHRLNGCCGLDGLDGPNLVCSGCRTEIGTEESDCWKPHLIVTLPDATKAINNTPD